MLESDVGSDPIARNAYSFPFTSKSKHPPWKLRGLFASTIFLMTKRTISRIRPKKTGLSLHQLSIVRFCILFCRSFFQQVHIISMMYSCAVCSTASSVFESRVVISLITQVIGQSWEADPFFRASTPNLLRHRE